jgi:hypothetical protein
MLNTSNIKTNQYTVQKRGIPQKLAGYITIYLHNLFTNGKSGDIYHFHQDQTDHQKPELNTCYLIKYINDNPTS